MATRPAQLRQFLSKAELLFQISLTHTNSKRSVRYDMAHFKTTPVILNKSLRTLSWRSDQQYQTRPQCTVFRVCFGCVLCVCVCVCLPVCMCVCTMVKLLSWTGGWPGGSTITLTMAVMTTVAPDVLMEVLGGELTASWRDSGASTSAGFYPEYTRRTENQAGVTHWKV